MPRSPFFCSMHLSLPVRAADWRVSFGVLRTWHRLCSVELVARGRHVLLSRVAFGCKRHQVLWLQKILHVHICVWLQKTPGVMVVPGCKRHLMPWLYLVAKDTWCHGCTWLQKAPDAMIVPGCKRHMMPWLYLVAEDTACAHLCLVAKDTRCHGCTWFQKTLDAMVVPGCRRHSVYCCAGLCLNDCKRHQVLWLYVVTKTSDSMAVPGSRSQPYATIYGDKEQSVWWLYLVGKRHPCDGCTWLVKDIQSDGCTWLAKDIQSDGCTWLKKVDHMLLSVVANNVQCDGCT